ncbi:DPH5-like protein, isoform CRA_d [Melanogaster broomeanus]|nr:DPH5-like protein, isoform CRA_d [Melanogaster broomeanus]
MFYVIGLGLCDEKDITVRGLEAVKASARVYLEAYTSILMVQKERLEAFYGKDLILADRDMVDRKRRNITKRGQRRRFISRRWRPVWCVWFHTTSATTHIDIVLRARVEKIPIRIIHNTSIMNAVGACGLQLYNFGKAFPLFSSRKPGSRTRSMTA